jgi:hypothetical protein
MNDIRPHFVPVATLALALGAATCSAAPAGLLQDGEIAAASSAQLRVAYLECDRLATESLMPAALMLTCQRVSDVLLLRDFGADLERQLQWWRVAREAYRRDRESVLTSAQDEP